MKLKSSFNTIDAEGNQIILAVTRPTAKQLQDANLIYSKTFKTAIDNGLLLKSELDNALRNRGLWNDEKDERHQTLVAELVLYDRQLSAGGIKLKEGRELALKMIKARAELRQLSADRSSLDSMTVEGQCENAKFNYLVSVCTVYNDTGKLYFKNYDDYLSRSDELATLQASNQLMLLMYDINEDYDASLPENKFLKQYGFINDKYQLLDEHGRTIDMSGRLVDENGRFIDEHGNFVDINGNRVDVNGNKIVDFKPFLDDDGNEIAIATDDVKSIDAPVEPKPKRKYNKLKTS